MTDMTRSPRLSALGTALERGATEALSAFWQDVARHGTPLVERIEDDERHVLVTFLWKATAPVGNVVVVSGIDGYASERVPAEHAMEHLSGTDLWYKTYRLRTDLCTTYELSPDDSLVPAGAGLSWRERHPHLQPDPLNPSRFVIPPEEGPSEEGEVSSVLALPGAAPQPWVAPRPGAPPGGVALHRFRSGILGNERRLWIYIPASYAPADDPYPLLLLFDGWTQLRVVGAPTTLDNLIAAGAVPPTVAVLIDNPNEEARNRELPGHPPFVDFLAEELLPWVRARYAVAVDPMQIVVGGQSFGGLAAAHASLRRPDLFGGVLAQSPACRWRPDGDEEYEWLARQYVPAPFAPRRFYLDAGVLETGPRDEGPNRLVAIRHFRDLLRAKGYPVHYAEYAEGHDYIWWRGTLADGLLALLGAGPQMAPRAQTRQSSGR